MGTVIIIFLLMFVYMLCYEDLSNPIPCMFSRGIKNESRQKNISILNWDLPYIRHYQTKDYSEQDLTKTFWYNKLLKFDLVLPGWVTWNTILYNLLQITGFKFVKSLQCGLIFYFTKYKLCLPMGGDLEIVVCSSPQSVLLALA